MPKDAFYHKLDTQSALNYNETLPIASLPSRIKNSRIST